MPTSRNPHAVYLDGYRAGVAVMTDRVEQAEAEADRWYQHALDPGAVVREMKLDLVRMSVREERAAMKVEAEKLDAAERELFGRAREMLRAGTPSIVVATQLEIYLPIVENIRRGVL